jgi:hypothetical protein
MTLNRALFGLVADAMEAHAELIDMGVWQEVPDVDGDDYLAAEITDVSEAMGMEALASHCGTACCAAGATIAVALDRGLIPRDDCRHIPEAAADLLGLTEDQATDLFHPESGIYGYANVADIVAVWRRIANGGDIYDPR